MMIVLVLVEKNIRNAVLKLIQITDCHLLQNQNDFFCGIQPDQQLMKILKAVKKQQPDALLLTGDLSQDGSPESYQHLASYLKVFTCPIYFIPGNHDDVDLCRYYLSGGNVQQKNQLTFGDWQLVFLDSVISGETAGHLKQDQFDLLAAHLKNGKNTLVCMHHHPISVSGFMDKYIVNNAQAFQEFIKDKRNLKLLIFGHIHADFHQKIHHVDFYGCPSTSVQFSLGEVESGNGIDDLTPGFRVIELFDGGFSTEVMRI